MKSIPKIWQKTPISYYGGKQTMLPYILPQGSTATVTVVGNEVLLRVSNV